MHNAFLEFALLGQFLFDLTPSGIYPHPSRPSTASFLAILLLVAILTIPALLPLCTATANNLDPAKPTLLMLLNGMKFMARSVPGNGVATRETLALAWESSSGLPVSHDSSIQALPGYCGNWKHGVFVTYEVIFNWKCQGLLSMLMLSMQRA